MSEIEEARIRTITSRNEPVETNEMAVEERCVPVRAALLARSTARKCGSFHQGAKTFSKELCGGTPSARENWGIKKRVTNHSLGS